MQRRQQSFSYPVFFHFAIRLCDSGDQKSGPVRTTDLDLLRVRVFLFQEPVIKVLTDCFPLVVEFIDVPRTSMRYAHYRPEGFRLAFAFMGFILGITHLSRIIIKDLVRISRVYIEINKVYQPVQYLRIPQVLSWCVSF